MAWFRTITGFIRVLLPLFVAAQLAGVVSLSPTSAHAARDVSAAAHHHHGEPGTSHHHHGDRTAHGADQCCALHGFFAGVLPPTVAVATFGVVQMRLIAALVEWRPGLAPGRLDRPPRGLPLI